MNKLSIVAGIWWVLSSAAFAASYKDVTSVEAKKLLDKGGVFLLDVRTPQEFQQARLQGAVLIPVDQVEKRLGEIPRNKPVMVYCAVGSRSRPVADFLGQKGFRTLYHMSDGIVGWYRNGLPLLR